MKIFGWAADYSGCGYYRLVLPLGELAAHGHTTRVSKAIDNWAADADVIIGQRVCKPDTSVTWQKIAAHKTRPMLVYELDDDLLTVDHTSRQAFAWFNRPEIRDHLIANIRVSDVVTVSTEPLADVVKEFNPNVRVVPNMIPGGMLDLPDRRRTDGVITIGWGGSNTHEMDFADASSELVRFIKRHPRTEYRAVGGIFRSMRGLPVAQVRVDSWFDEVADFHRAIDYHIGIAPLRPHVFNRSKSDIKFLECAARRAAFVASDVGPYARSVEPGRTGLLVNRPHEWSLRLRELVNDPAMRDELAGNAYAYAETRTIEGNWGLWEKALTP